MGSPGRYHRYSSMSAFLLYVMFISYGVATIALLLWNHWVGIAWVVITLVGFYKWAGDVKR